MKQIYLFDIPNVVIGTRTVEEDSFQVCNFMNMLQYCIHASDSEEVYNTGSCMTIGVVYHNLLVTIRRLESCVADTSYVYHRHKEILQTIKVLLTIVLKENRTQEKDTKNTKRECDMLWDVCYDHLHDRFPLIKQYTYIIDK